MDELTYRLNGIENDVKRLITVVERLSENNKNQKSEQEQAYYTLREAVEKKFGKNVAYTTISTNSYLMPGANTGYKIMGGCKRWPAEIVNFWVNLDDRGIYNFCVENNIPLVGRNGEKLLKYAKEKDYGKKN